MTRGKGTSLCAHQRNTPQEILFPHPGNASISSIYRLCKRKPESKRSEQDAPYGDSSRSDTTAQHTARQGEESYRQCALQNLPRSFGDRFENMSLLFNDVVGTMKRFFNQDPRHARVGGDRCIPERELAMERAWLKSTRQSYGKNDSGSGAR